MNAQVLFVDDDANVLAAYVRNLRRQFTIQTALGGGEGLVKIASEGPYAVVVADMRMPGMDGIRFLARVKEIAPDSVRMMLTGNADLQTAIGAINDGNIFRFLVKPCLPEIIAQALLAGIAQYHLVLAERELLEKTLTGSVKLLTEILSLANPAAFSQATRLRRYVRHIAAALQLADPWQYELAATLSQIGCITLPPHILERVWMQQSLSEEEQKAFVAHPSIGSKLLANIPRLEIVSRMIEGQHCPILTAISAPLPTGRVDAATLGAQILPVVIDFDGLVVRGTRTQDALAAMHLRRDEYNPQVLAALATFRTGPEGGATKLVTVSDLALHMIIEEDVLAKTGLLLVAKGQEVTLPVLVALRNFAQHVGVQEPFRVSVAASA